MFDVSHLNVTSVLATVPPVMAVCLALLHKSVSSIVIYIPSFDLMFKQLNKASRMVAHFPHRS